MKKFRKIGSKIMTSLFALAVMFSIMQISVHAADEIEIKWKEGTTVFLKESDVISITADKKNVSIYLDGRFIGQYSKITVDYTSTFKLELKYNELGEKSMYGYAPFITTVNNGTPSTTRYMIGDTVSITADTPASGKQFKEWQVMSGDIVLENSTSATTTFTMPANNVEVTAIYEPHIHTAGTDWYKDDTNHWHLCTAGDNHKMNVTTHSFSEWVIDTPATATTVGSQHRDCVCGQTETAEIPATGVKPDKPVISAGAGSIHQISNGKDMTLTCTGKLEDLEGIYVDGKLVDTSNYMLKSGSTILTLKASYLDALSAGSHTLKFQYKDNLSADTTFTITAKADVINPEKPADTVKPETGKTDAVIKDTASPKTGDTSNTMLYFSLVLLSGCAVTFMIRRKKAINK